MELTWCQSFIAVHETGGFSTAARSLHRSQSRISAHVAGLEKYVGDRLFHRDVHPPTLTAAGAAFLPHARGMVDEWTAAVASVGMLREEVHGTVAVGSVPSASTQILAPVLAGFATTHPHVRFEVHEGPNSWLDEALARRTIEIALRPVIEQRHDATVQRVVLVRDPFVLVLPEEHPLAQHEQVDLAELAGEAVITTGEAGLDARIGAEFRTLLAPFDVDEARSMAVTQPTTVFSFVSHGLGLGLIGDLPGRMLNVPGLVTRLVRHPDAYRDIAAHWATTRRLSPAGAIFLDEVRASCDRIFGPPEPS
ncbi:LysR family transcriptional regulator [Ruania alkalisoli]|uniref:LysR family transcriptional regulator n=1 Tax=Ruania alkalisoli TaxID=2779775 RepID=A0A7M1SY15_9MICO|nr:LysR family transcriptional regulator [Ruania alkalisoli]QOR72439.1 LysR family transcriptional regulator [Ruania alkalisoli]